MEGRTEVREGAGKGEDPRGQGWGKKTREGFGIGGIATGREGKRREERRGRWLEEGTGKGREVQGKERIDEPE